VIKELEKPKASAEELAKTIIGLAMKVHRVLGPGFLESVYHRALLYELAQAGLKTESEKQLEVHYSGIVVGEFVADILVEDQLIVELKAVQELIPAHSVQLVNYLSATGLEWGVLLNFGSKSLEFKKRSRIYKETTRTLPRSFKI
jgi:GxxExxY protein